MRTISIYLFAGKKAHCTHMAREGGRTDGLMTETTVRLEQCDLPTGRLSVLCLSYDI